MFCDQSPPLHRHGSEDCRPGRLHVVHRLRAEHPGPVAGLDDIEHVGPADEGPDVGDEDHAGVRHPVRQLRQRVEEGPASTVSQATVAQPGLSLGSEVEMAVGAVRAVLQQSESGQVCWADGGVVIHLQYHVPAW